MVETSTDSLPPQVESMNTLLRPLVVEVAVSVVAKSSAVVPLKSLVDKPSVVDMSSVVAALPMLLAEPLPT